MKVLKRCAEVLTAIALERANDAHPPFNSDHEGLAVLYEEIEETERELRAIKRNMCNVWVNVREDDHEKSLENIEKIRRHAINLIAEAGQVAAMCDKYKEER